MKILLDVHTHTAASGHAFSTLQEMVRTAADKGLQILGITEHTGGIPGTCSPIYFRNLPVVPAADVRGGTLIRRRDEYSRL